VVGVLVLTYARNADDSAILRLVFIGRENILPGEAGNKIINQKTDGEIEVINNKKGRPVIAGRIKVPLKHLTCLTGIYDRTWYTLHLVSLVRLSNRRIGLKHTKKWKGI
jgi:hypothetical protein